MATDKTQSDLVAYVAWGDRTGSTRITFRYRDNTTKTYEDGVLTETGVASETHTWWR